MRFDTCGYAWKDIWEKLLDYYDRVVGIQQQQQALDTQIRIEQIETVKEATTDLWDAYVHSNELAVERQHQQHMMVRDFVYGEIESWNSTIFNMAQGSSEE